MLPDKTKPYPCETEAEKVSSAVTEPQAVKVVGNWLNEWREQKPKDARLAFAALFGNQPSAIS